MSEKIDEIGRKLLKYPNVTGYDKKLVKRIRDGREVDEYVIQVHVSKKIPKNCMRAEDLLPEEIDGVEVDVVKRGPFKALNVTNPNTILKHRPVIAGVSIGNKLISAGTNGWFMKSNIYPGEIFFGSNAHVFTPDVRLDCFEPTIVQPGPADIRSGDISDYKAGGYVWHKKLHPEEVITDCKIINAYAGLGNAVARMFRRKSRIKSYMPEQEKNHIDFAVARPSIEVKTEIIETRYASTEYEFVGFGFAGGDADSLVCKQNPYISETGWMPHRYDVAMNVSVDDILYKTGRTSFKTQNTVISSNVVEKVDYDGFSVVFDDVILTKHLLEPGDSGSAVFKRINN
jgi:hypothetical protein